MLNGTDRSHVGRDMQSTPPPPPPQQQQQQQQALALPPLSSQYQQRILLPPPPLSSQHQQRISPLLSAKDQRDIATEYRIRAAAASDRHRRDSPARSPGSASPPESPLQHDASRDSDMDEFMESENEDGALNLVWRFCYKNRH